jgi:hypothetical protein
MPDTSALIAQITEMASIINGRFVPDPEKIAIFERAQAEQRREIAATMEARVLETANRWLPW